MRALCLGFVLCAVLLPGGAVRAATFTIADGDVATLVTDLTTANRTGQADTINLAAGGTSTRTKVDNPIPAPNDPSGNGPNGLPVIGADEVNNVAHPLTINGNGD